MKHFVEVFFASLFLAALAVAGLNYCVDPAGIFDGSIGGRELQLAKILARHSNALVDFNFNERRFQKYRIRLEKSGGMTIVTGSSRSMQLSSKIIGEPILNISVSAASMEDHIGLAMAALRKLGARKYILGIDPWAFSEYAGQDWGEDIADEYIAGAAQIGLPYVARQIEKSNKYLQLINFAYTKESLHYLVHDNGSVKEQSSDKPAAAADLIRGDGSRVYNQKALSNSKDAMIAAARVGLRKDDYFGLRGFTLSGYALVQFKHLLDYLSKAASVRIFLPPFHPVVYPWLVGRYPEVVEVERIIRMEAAERNIKVLGSYDPALAGCDDNDFVDFIHLRDECVKKIVSPTLSGSSR